MLHSIEHLKAYRANSLTFSELIEHIFIIRTYSHGPTDDDELVWLRLRFMLNEDAF